MSSTLWTALCLQVVAVAVMRHRLGPTWLRRPVTVLVLTALVYSGMSEVLLAFPSIRAWDNNRIGTEQIYIDEATLFMTIGLLALVAGYLVTRPERAAGRTNSGWPSIGVFALDWRLPALGCAPLAIITYQGQGYNSGIVSGAASATTSTNLASEFLIVLLALAAFGFLLRHGMRWFIAVLAAQSIVLAAAGERMPLVMSGVILLILLAHMGMRPSRRQIGVALALTAVIILSLTGYRAESGRALFHQNSGAQARVQAIGSGFNALVNTSDTNNAGPGLIAQIAKRFDGNSFAGTILQGLHSGFPTLGVAEVGESMLVLVPSAAWSAKLSHTGELNPTSVEAHSFGIEPITGEGISPLPTFLGLYLGFIGPYWLITLMAALGVLLGCGEKWLFDRLTVVRIILLAGSVQFALSYEAGLPSMLVALRTALVLGATLKLLEVLPRLEVGRGHHVGNALNLMWRDRFSNAPFLAVPSDKTTASGQSSVNGAYRD